MLKFNKKIFQKLNIIDLLVIILVLFSDHGTSYGNKIGERFYGSLCYDDTLKTFAIFHSKEFPIFKTDKLTRSVDIMPTILEALQIKQDNDYMEISGASLLPIIKNEESEARTAFSEVSPLEGTSDYPSSKEPNIHSIKTQDWKLIFNKPLNKFEFYNIKEDPNEKNNLIGKGFEEVEMVHSSSEELEEEVIKEFEEHFK